jgi:hypothetical protein
MSHKQDIEKRTKRVKGVKWGGGGVNDGMLAKKGDQDRGKFLCISPVSW